MKIRGALLVLLTAALADGAGCAPGGPPSATANDAQRGNVELAELKEGRQLLIGKCTACHRAPMPNEHSPAEWPVKLDEMASRAKLDLGQQKLIEKYLVTMSTR